MAKTANGKAPQRYHHGALREALLRATEEILLHRGVEGFTLRECARRAGVSHAAPAHHFGDAKGLLTEFALEGFLSLGRLMQQYRAKAATDGFSQLTAVGQAYVRFALKHRAQFQLMFRNARLDLNRTRFTEVAEATFAHLGETLSQTLREAGVAQAAPAKLAAAWSLVHGYASLATDNDRFIQIAGGKQRLRDTLVQMQHLFRATLES